MITREGAYHYYYHPLIANSRIKTELRQTPTQPPQLVINFSYSPHMIHGLLKARYTIATDIMVIF